MSHALLRSWSEFRLHSIIPQDRAFVPASRVMATGRLFRGLSVCEYQFDGRAAETDLLNSVRSALGRGGDARVVELPRFVFDMNGKFVDHFPVLHQDTVSLEFQLVFAALQLAAADGGGAGQRDRICLRAGDRSAEQREC